MAPTSSSEKDCFQLSSMSVEWTCWPEILDLIAPVKKRPEFKFYQILELKAPSAILELVAIAVYCFFAI
jgi:hypothetical protein